MGYKVALLWALVSYLENGDESSFLKALLLSFLSVSITKPGRIPSTSVCWIKEEEQATLDWATSAPSAPTSQWLELEHGNEVHSLNVYLFWCQADEQLVMT